MKKLIIILGILLTLGGLAFALSQTSLFKGDLLDEPQVLLDGATLDDGSLDQPNFTPIEAPIQVNPPDNAGPIDPGYERNTIECGVILIKVEDTAGNELTQLDDYDFNEYQSDGSTTAHAQMTACLNSGYAFEYLANYRGNDFGVYQIPMPINQAFYIEAIPDGYVSDKTTSEINAVENADGSLGYRTLTLDFGVTVNVSPNGGNFTQTPTVRVNGSTCQYRREVGSKKQFGCRISVQESELRVEASATSFDSYTGGYLAYNRHEPQNPTQVVEVSLNRSVPTAYYAYLDVESDRGVQINNLRNSNFEWRSGFDTLIEEDNLAQGNYWIEVSNDQTDDLTVSATGYESGGDTIRAYESKAEAKLHPHRIVLNQIEATQYFAYVQIENTEGDAMNGLLTGNFDLRSGAPIVLDEDDAPNRGSYWLELQSESDDVSVTVEGYQTGNASLLGYSSKTAAKARPEQIVLRPITQEATTQRVCSAVTLTPGSLQLNADESTRTLSLSVDASFRDDTVGQTGNLWAYVRDFVGWMAQASLTHDFVAQTSTPWSGTMRIEIQGDGRFPAVAIGNNKIMEGPMNEEDFPNGATYEAHEGDVVSVKLTHNNTVECQDSFTVTKAAPAQAAAPAPAPSKTEAYLVIELLDEDDQAIENVRESSFDYNGGDDNDILDFDEYDNGLYLFKMFSDTYEVDVDVNDYVPENETGLKTYSSDSSAKSNPYTIVLSKEEVKRILSDENYKCDYFFDDTRDDLICRMHEAEIFRGYGDGQNFGPYNTITEAEALATMLRAKGYTEDDAQTLPNVTGLPNVKSYEWYYPWYKIAQDERIIRDYANPNGPIRRATYAVLAARTWSKELRGWGEDDIDFKDLSKSMPETYAIILMNNTYVDVPGEGLTPIIEGYPDDTFRPNNNILRKDAAYMLYRILLGWELELPIETQGLSF